MSVKAETNPAHSGYLSLCIIWNRRGILFNMVWYCFIWVKIAKFSPKVMHNQKIFYIPYIYSFFYRKKDAIWPSWLGLILQVTFCWGCIPLISESPLFGRNHFVHIRIYYSTVLPLLISSAFSYYCSTILTLYHFTSSLNNYFEELPSNSNKKLVYRHFSSFTEKIKPVLCKIKLINFVIFYMSIEQKEVLKQQ